MTPLILFLALVLQDDGIVITPPPEPACQLEARSGQLVAITWECPIARCGDVSEWRLYRQSSETGTSSIVSRAFAENVRTLYFRVPTGTTLRRYWLRIRPVWKDEEGKDATVGPAAEECVVDRVP